jgi:hypothetical protein
VRQEERLQRRRQLVERWLDEHGEVVFKACLSRCGSVAAAEQRFVEVFLEAFMARSRRRMENNPEAWLLERVAETPVSAETLGRSSVDDSQPADAQRGPARGNDIPTNTRAEAGSVSEHTGEGAGCADVRGADGRDETGWAVSLEMARLRVRKLLKAAVVGEQALERQRGPGWTRYALVLTAVFGLFAVVAADYGDSWLQPAHSAEDAGNKGRALPPVLDNLPVTTRAQFGLSQADLSLSHAAASREALFLPRLQTTDAEGTREIDVYGYRYRDSGRALDSAQNLFGRIRLRPPGERSTADLDWQVTDWTYAVSGEWGIATVRWQQRGAKDAAVLQIYALSLADGKSALVKTLPLGTEGIDDYTVTVGAGRVAVEGSLSAQMENDTGTPVGLPIQVYNLQGMDPAHALVLWKQISAPAGPLTQPVLTKDGLLSQAWPDATTDDTSWYFLSWNGQVLKLAGPPSDGQPHWAVRTADNRNWWVETTPDPKQAGGRLQVLMGSLDAKASDHQASTLALNGSVRAFQVSGDFLIWVQDTGKVPQLVVTEVK